MRLIVLALGLLLLVALPASATTPRLTADLFLARVAVNEAGWTSFETGDMTAIHEVFLRGSSRQAVSYVSYATHYSQRVAGIRPTTSGRIAWTMNLRPDGREPANWPRFLPGESDGVTVVLRPHPPWSNYRDAWLATLERAREVSSWTLDDIDEWSVCDGQVHDWGSPRLDRARAESLGLIEVECGETRNDFWARPSLLPNDDVEIDRD